MTAPYTLAQLLTVAFRRRLADLHTAMPARVEAYDATKQVVDCTPLLEARVELEDGTFLDSPLPVLVNVPVVFPGAGGHRLTFPVQVGDTVLVVFAEGSLESWQRLGGVQPTDGRRHHLADAIAIPGLHHDGAPWGDVPTDSSTFGPDNGPQVVAASAELRLGGNTATPATHPAVLGDVYRTAEDTMLSTSSTALKKAVTDLGLAVAALTTAIPLNAVPIVGGALAAAPLALVVTELAQVAADLGAVAAAIDVFQLPASTPTYLSQVVKVR